MIRFDQVLSRLTIACLVVWVIVFGLKLFCEWTAIRKLAFANESLKGKKSNVLFERAPILPDRIIFSSAVPDTIVFEYLDGQCGLLKYPRVNIIVRSGVIEDTFGVQ